MTPEETKRKSPVRTVTHLHHGENRYSISICIDDVHTSLSTLTYPHCAGGNTDISIFSLSPEDVLRLGNLITEQAFRIKGLVEAGNEDRV